MNIKELIKKLFKYGTKNYGLALPTDLVSVPMRDSLDDDKIKELDEYKDNYLEILSQKKHFTSRDISSQDFNQEMIMNFELFGRLVINHDNNYNLDTMADYEKKELWLKQMINPRKIKLYIDKMEAMYNETHLRLVALKEIYSEIGKKLTKDKQNAILNEIYNLTSNYIIFKNNVYAALKEVETYKKEINNLEYKIEYEEEDVYLLSQYGFKLYNYASMLIPDRFNEIEKKNNDDIDIACIEREMEIYAYKNLKVDDLNQELEDIDKIEKTPENRQMLLDRINELEIKYIVLSNYGGHELDLKPLYEVKFDILTINIVNQEESPFKNIPVGRELKYYEDIILDRITTNITGIDSLLNQRLDDGKKYLINYIVELLKYDNLNLRLILQSTFSLSLVLSAESDEKMNYFFNNYQIDFEKNDLPYHFARKSYDTGMYIETESVIPLSTVCWINNINILMLQTGQGFINGDTNRIVEIYNYFSNKANENSSQYKIPDGIIKIEMPFDGAIARDLILDKAEGKTLITPSSLKTLKLPKVFGNLYVHKVILNEGLESITGPALIDDTANFLTIPSTLQNAYESVLSNVLHSHDAFAWDYDVLIEKIVFTNCEDSITLHDEKQMDDIIRCLYEASMWHLWNKLNSGKVKPPYVGLSFLPRDIVLISKDGRQAVVSISTIVNIEFLIMMKSIYAKGFNSRKSKYIYLYFKGKFEEKIINEAKEKINEVINNEIKTTNKKK